MRLRPSLILLTLALSIWITQGASTQAPRAFEVARGLAQRHLDELVARHGGDRGTGRRDLRGMLDADGRSHHAVRQLHRGVPVWGGEAIIHLDAGGDLEALTDDFIDDLSPIDVTPAVTAAEAIDFATFASGLTREMLTAEPQADLWVMRGDADRLVYRVQLRREDGSPETSMPVVFIDAHDGSLVDNYDNLQTGTAPVSGTSNYYGSLSLTGFLNGATYYLEDVGRKLGTFTYNNGTSSLFRTTDSDGAYTASNQKAMVDAQYVASKTYDYYKNVHGRNGIDGGNGPGYLTSIDGVTKLMSSMVHYSNNYNNAFWNGQYITYGDGDGTTFTPLTTLDIGGHEMTHGVTERTAGLVYSGESGALNESFSDVFGAMVERYASGESANTWKIGELAFTPSNGTGDALRYMDNPHLASNADFTSDDDPDHYSERYTGTSDNGGVHINSGIANKAFYLVAKGGTHHLGGSMTGIGADAASAIWYKALTTYMTSSTNFAGARTATLNAAAAIYGTGSTYYNAVCDAWSMVGVGASCGAPPPPPPPPSGGLLSNSGFETSINPWVASGTGAFYIANGNYPHGGTGYIYFGTTNSATGQTYQQVSIPSTATGTLTFWLNTTSDETTTTTQYDKLFVEVRNTAGTLLSTVATFSNLSKTTAGSYSQKSFSLAAFKGQTVRIQFRVSTDSTLPTTFRIDDACLDGCSSGTAGSPTTTTVAASPASPVYGTAVTFTATVTGSGSCDPAGTVKFVDGATTIGSASLNASNQAAVTTSSLSAGPHTISAAFAPSSSACLTSNGSVATTIAKANQSINFGALADKKYGDAPLAVGATATSGLPVSFSILSGPATINGSTVTITGTGVVTVRASQAGDTNYNAAANVDQSFNVAKASQTITFFAPANKTYGDAPFPVSANASSGLVVAFSIASGPATVAGNTVTLTGAGTVVVRASQSGNNNYSPAPDVDRSITVAQKSQTIAFFAPANKTYGDAPFPVSANASSGLVVAFSIASGPATVAGNTVTLTGAGTVVVRASQGGNKDYSPAPDVDRSIAVAKKSQTIDFAPLADHTFGDAPFALPASASSSLAVKFAVVSGPATIGVGNMLSLTGAGTVVIRASQAGNADYEAATDVDRKFTVAKAGQSITFIAPPNKTYGDAPFPVSANASSGLVVAFSIASGPATVTGNLVKLSGPGTVVVRASQGGNNNYNAAPDVDRSFTVAKGKQTITFAQPPNRTAEDDPFPLAATSSSGLTVEFSLISGPATVAGNIVSLTRETGTVIVRASQPGDANYDPAADVDRAFEVLPAGQKIEFAPIANRTFGDPPFTVSATADSGLPVSFTIVSGPATIAGELVTITGAGAVIVRASQPGDQTHSAAADVDQSFSVAKADQSIAFGALAARTFGDAPFEVDAAATSSLPVSFSIASGPAVINRNIVSITGAGVVVVRASQGGDDNYNAATDVDQPLTVGKADQAITFDALANKTFGDAPFAVNATASSGLAVSFTILSGPATPAGNIITITGVGTVIVRASQGGDDNYNTAADVDQSFTVNQPTQSIVFDSIDDVTYGAAPIVLTATASSGLPVTFSIVNGPAQVAGNVLSITGAGAVTVRASQPGDANHAPADSVDHSFTVAPAELIVTANSASRSYWDPDPPIAASINGLVNGDAISALISTGTNDETPAGAYPLQVTLSDPGNRLPNYAVSTLLGTFTILNPAPAITSLDPTSFAAGNGDRQLTIHGQDFVPQSMVFWSGNLLQTVSASQTQLTVTVPAASAASATVSYVTVANGGPGGGVAGPEEFFVTNTGAPVDDADTGTADEGGTADASVGGTGPGTPDSVSVSAVGEGSVTVAQFDGNPGPPATFQNSDRFFDVFVPSTSAFTSLTIVSCDMNGGNVVLWSDGVTWMPVSNQTYNPSTGCVTIVVDDTTSPSLSQLTGTYFVAAADTTAPTTEATASTAGGAYVFGTWANDSVTVNLHAADNTGGVGVASLTSSAAGATTVPETTAPGADRAFTITADGETTLAFYATDAAGNVESVQTRIVRINRQPPTGTAQASPAALWPPNNKPVPVTISGRFTGGVAVASATFAVADEYGEVSPSGAVSVAADGSYRFTVMLPASRRGDDQDGRTFAIRVDGIDGAGNRGTAETIVLVPHSQGK